ncbi:hypothetical protein HDU98_010710 [Podochytrium sp. JEL0797]|nr:hypothetical protein HDU98_010710 [Podochytrium sp. JEL0797]
MGKRQGEWTKSLRLVKALEQKEEAEANTKLLEYDEVIMEPWKHKVVSRLRLNFAVVNPRNITRYGMRQIDAQELIDSGYISSLCSQSDIIVVADTVPDARGILLSLLSPDPSLRCSSNIIIEMTNRFDWMVKDEPVYYAMLLQLFEHPPKNLFWAANNPFEGPFMHAKVGKAPKVRLVRSLGVWDIEPEPRLAASPLSLPNEALGAPTAPTLLDSFVLLKNPDIIARPIIEDVFKYYCMPVKTLPKKYGGPTGLLQYKGFIEFPYQVSVMKFYENVAFGVPQLLPTPELLRKLVKSNNHHLFSTWLEKLEDVHLFLTDPEAYHEKVLLEAKNHPTTTTTLNPPLSHRTIKRTQPTTPARAQNPRILERRGHPPSPAVEAEPYNATWSELSDFYRKEFEPFVYYFDSFKELEELINKPYAEFDYKNVRVEGPKFYAKIREESMRTWVGMFTEMGFSVHDFGK